MGRAQPCSGAGRELGHTGTVLPHHIRDTLGAGCGAGCVLPLGPEWQDLFFFFLMLVFLSMLRTYPGITKVNDALCCPDLKPPESLLSGLRM